MGYELLDADDGVIDHMEPLVADDSDEEGDESATQVPSADQASTASSRPVARQLILPGEQFFFTFTRFFRDPTGPYII